MVEDLRQRLKIPYAHLDEINALLLDPDERVVNDFMEVVARYGTPEEINRKADAARQMPALLERVRAVKPEYVNCITTTGRLKF